MQEREAEHKGHQRVEKHREGVGAEDVEHNAVDATEAHKQGDGCNVCCEEQACNDIRSPHTTQYKWREG